MFLSHDWPQHIEQHGDFNALMKIKPFWKDDIAHGNFGSPPLMGLLQTLRPPWWFAAHMHVRFKAVVEHPPPPILTVDNPEEIAIDFDDDLEVTPIPRSNPDEIMLDDEEVDVVAPPPLPPPTQAQTTTFLALDKCLPKRKFLEVVDIDTPELLIPGQEPVFTYDLEWLAINRAFASWFSQTKHQRSFPGEGDARKMVAKEMEWVKKNIGDKKEVNSCQQFVRVAPGPEGEEKDKNKQRESRLYVV